jgi:hypothetical protein
MECIAYPVVNRAVGKLHVQLVCCPRLSWAENGDTLF